MRMSVPPGETNSKAACPSQVIWISFFFAGASVCARATQSAVTTSTPSQIIFFGINDFFIAICEGRRLFLIVRRHAKHSNRHRFAIALNVSLFNTELDDGSRHNYR
jgi:hypothetical protein